MPQRREQQNGSEKVKSRKKRVSEGDEEKLKCACWWRQRLDFEAWEITKLLASSCQSVEGSLLSAPMHMRVAQAAARPPGSEGRRRCQWPRRLAWRSRSSNYSSSSGGHEVVVVEDDVPEWIDKGFVINEKQVAYESKNVKKRKICVSHDWQTDRRTSRDESWNWFIGGPALSCRRRTRRSLCRHLRQRQSS